jgi:hypothetical protein
VRIDPRSLRTWSCRPVGRFPAGRTLTRLSRTVRAFGRNRLADLGLCASHRRVVRAKADGFRAGRTRKDRAMAGAIDPLRNRKNALDAFLETKVAEGFRIEDQSRGVIAPAYRP